MHSPNAIPCTDGVMVNLDHMDSIEQVLQDGKRKCACTRGVMLQARRLIRSWCCWGAPAATSLVRCQAGVRLRQLNEVLLERYSLALPSLGSISEQSIAGAVSTATHGTGIKLGVLSVRPLLHGAPQTQRGHWRAPRSPSCKSWTLWRAMQACVPIAGRPRLLSSQG